MRGFGGVRACARVVVTTALVVAAMGSGEAMADAPAMPPATYPQTVSQQLLVPMDDGVRIATTVTFPSLDGQTPAPGSSRSSSQMTPYGREGSCSCFPGEDFASRGIVSAVADVRGTGGSEGSLKDNYFSPREQRDGYELVEHFGTQPYSSGKVGMAGGSYVGITQYLAAEQQPPHLAVITPTVALSDLYREGYTHDGVPNFFFDIQYLGVQEPAGLTGPNTDPGPDRGDRRGEDRSGAGRVWRRRSTTSRVPTTSSGIATARRCTAPTRSRFRS